MRTYVMRQIFVAFVVSCLSFGLEAAVAQQPAKECRSIASSVKGVATTKMMCKDSDGQWREPAPAFASGPIPANFRGSIKYVGEVKGANFGRAPRTKPIIDLGGMLQRATGLGGEPYARTVTVKLEFDGNLVTGLYEAVEQGGRRSAVKLNGLREGGVCKLFNDRRESYTGPCDGASFTGVEASGPQSRTSWQGKFAVTAVETVDFAERDRLAAIAAAEAKAKAEAARQAVLAQRAQMRAALPKGAATRYKPLLEKAVSADAMHWFSNRYAAGSIDLVGVQNDAPSGAVFLKAYFNYADGREGWVGAIVKAQTVQCLQFWDDSSGCRGIGNGMNAKLAQGFVEGMFTGGGGGSSGSMSDDAGYDAWEQSRDRGQSSPAPAPAPVTPIGGDRGLYGDNHGCCE